MKVTKAAVATVQIGTLTVEGVMMPDGTFGITLQQANELASFDARQDNAGRSLKALLGGGSTLVKMATDRHERQKVKEVILTLEQFEKAIVESALKGNEKAVNLLRLFTGLSLHQLWAFTFDVKFDQADIQAKLAAKWEALESATKTRNFFTYVLQKYGVDTSTLPKYGRATIFNYRLAGLEKEYLAYRAIHNDSHFRKSRSVEEIKRIEWVEETIARMMGKGMSYDMAYDKLRIFTSEMVL